jgi:hypothetical protein
MSGKSVSFSLNSSNAGTATVGSDGSFSKTVTGLVAGSNSITVSFAAITTYTATSQSITVNRSTFDGLADLELIDGSQILSYADEQSTPNSQYATLETQLMNGDSPAAISGVTVAFYNYADENNPVLLGSDDTDSTGKASFTYHSSGVGDVPIKAKVGRILTKTYDVEDCTYYNPDEISTNTDLNIILPNAPFIAVFDMKRESSSSYPTLTFGVDDNNRVGFGVTRASGKCGLSYQVNGTRTTLLETSNNASTSYFTSEYSYDNGLHTYKTLGESINYTGTSFSMDKLVTAYANSGKIKNIKIKPL